MQFPFIKTSEKQKNFFLSFLIKPDKVGAILFEEINSKLFILATKEIETDDTDSLTSEELLSAADKVISSVEEKLPEGSEVEKTIFSVPYYWVKNGKILDSHLEKLKKVCKDLDLIPIGYIVSIEAIVAFLQKTEGAPVSGIFIEVTSTKLLMYLVRANKIIEEKQSELEEGVIKSSEKLLQEIQSVDVLPSKIIILDYKDSVSVQQEFLSHQWPKEIPFLHLPQAMILEKGFENEAIINGVATQMELEVLHDAKSAKAVPESVSGELEQADAEDFGFVKEGRDPAKKTEKIPEIEEENPDVEKVDIESSDSIPEIQEAEEDEPNISYFKEDSAKHLKLAIRSIPAVGSIFKILRSKKIPSISLASNFSGPLKVKLIVSLAAVVLFAFLLSFVYYNLILKADIRITSDKKNIDKTANVLFSNSPTDESNIKIELATQAIEGTENKNATGKKETGEKAKGEITLYNKTDQKKTFAKGTIIVGPNNLEFELVDEVAIASTSPFSTSLSNAKGKITASKIGREYNLASNTNFTVKGFSSAQYIGKNSDSITGGTKKETTVVSSDDLDELLTEVLEKLEKEALSKISGKISSGEELISKSIAAKVLEKKYSKKEGDEVGSVGISAKIEYSFGKYKKSDLEKVVESLSKGDIPGTYVLKTSDSKVEITDVKVDDETAKAKLKINAIYTPQIEGEKLAASLKGKSRDKAESQIKNIEGVTEVLITFKNTLPLMPLVLPQNPKNILIEEEY